MGHFSVEIMRLPGQLSVEINTFTKNGYRAVGGAAIRRQILAKAVPSKLRAARVWLAA